MAGTFTDEPGGSPTAFSLLSWRIRVTVMRSDMEDADHDIYLMKRVWQGEDPHKDNGQNVEGACWLQKSLWVVIEPAGAASEGTSA